MLARCPYLWNTWQAVVSRGEVREMGRTYRVTYIYAGTIQRYQCRDITDLVTHVDFCRAVGVTYCAEVMLWQWH